MNRRWALLSTTLAALNCGGALHAQDVILHTASTGVPLAVAIDAGPFNAQGHPTIYVAERLGTVRLIDTVTGAVSAAPVLTTSIPAYVGGDAGLQCIARGPEAVAGTGGYLYVYYNTSATSAVLERQMLNTSQTEALPGTAQIILRYQRSNGHNGGWLGFSPLDGYLYLSLGDGGTAADPDPLNASQSLTGPNVRQGKILRLNPDADAFPDDPDQNFTIPPDNPLIGQTSNGEVWDYGLRNPWRCAFDPENGDLWIADVGQETYEEINVERAATPGGAGGHNYGWKCYEGSQFTGYAPCTSSLPFTPPLYTYTHADGCSITGGVVYRGSRIPALNGAYLFSDYCESALWALRTTSGSPVRTTLLNAGTRTVEGDLVSGVASFGTDAAGEVYIADTNTGRIYRLTPAACAADLGSAGGLSTPDGNLDNNDFVAFINDFFSGEPRADVGLAGGLTGADGVFDNNDFVAFINLFFNGC